MSPPLPFFANGHEDVDEYPREAVEVLEAVAEDGFVRATATEADDPLVFVRLDVLGRVHPPPARLVYGRAEDGARHWKSYANFVAA